MKNKKTTKVCPKCGCTALVLLTSQNTKICGDCSTHIPWYLEPGQKSLHGTNPPPEAVEKYNLPVADYSILTDN